jgi:hypothetical protein
MSRTRTRSKPRLTQDGKQLVSLALGLAASNSLVEDRYWENALNAMLSKMLNAHNDAAIDSALGYLYDTNTRAFEGLIDVIEGLSESVVIEHQGESWDVLLISAPIIASSKYAIPLGPLTAEQVAELQELLEVEILASGTRVALAPHLFTLEHLPKRFSAMHELTQRLGAAALGGQAPKLGLGKLPETPQMLADIRFVLAAVAAKRNAAHFSWQQIGTSRHVGRAQALEQWNTLASAKLLALLPGCQFECLLPDAYFANSREADRRTRPVAVRAAVSFLTSALKATPTELRAVVAGFGEQRVDEYRIAFTQRDSNDVVYGVVWPLYGDEDDGAVPSPLDEIETCLQASGVTRIERLSERFQPQFCADCGAPLFADPAGEVLHAEMPEEADVEQNYLH